MTPTVAALDASTWLFPAFGWTLRTGLEACAIAVLVIAAQGVLGDRVSARWRYNLWLLVVARLVLPSVPTRFSPFNAVVLGDAPPAASITQSNPSPAPPPVIARIGPASVEWPADVSPPDDAPGTVTVLPHDSQPKPVPPPALPADAPLAHADEPTPAADEPAESDHGSRDASFAFIAPAEIEPTAERQAEIELPLPTPHAEPARGISVVIPTTAPAVSRPPIPAPLPSVPEPTLSKLRDWKLAVASIWAAGLVVCLTRLALNALRLSRKLRRMPVIADAELLSALRGAAATLGVRRLPQVRLAPDDCPPALVGALKPRLLLSHAVLTSLSPAALRLVLLHELEHLKRRDVLANWLLAVIAAAHWFNPLLWLCFRRMRADRELACDEQVLRVSAADAAAAGGAGRERYGQTIVNVLHVLSSRAGRSPAATAAGVLDGKNFLRRRIIMIARLERAAADGASRRRVSVLGCAASVLLGAVALTGAVRGQDAPTPEVSPAAATTAGLPGAAGAVAPAAEIGGQGAPGLPGSSAAQPGGVAPPAGKDGNGVPGAPGSGAAPTSSPANGVGHDQNEDDGGHADAGRRARATATLQADLAAAKAKLQAAKISAEYKAAEAARVAEQVKAALISASEAERIKADAAIAGIQIDVAQAELQRAQAALAQAEDDRRVAARAMKRDAELARVGAASDPPGGGGLGGVPPGAAVAAGGAGVTTRVEDGTTRSADLRTWKQLGGPITAQLSAVSLGDALDYLSDQAGVTVFADWHRIDAAGVERESPVSVRLRDPMPADQVLELILRSAGGEQLGFTVDRGVVVIDTVDGIRRTIVTRAYDVGDLRRVDEDVASAVRESVRPDAWRQAPNLWGVGATGGTIRMFGDQLIVSTDEPTHREVEKLLGLLRTGAEQDGGRLRKSDAAGDGPALRTQAAASALARTSKDRWVFVPQTAAKAVEWIARESGVPIRLDEEALKSIGVDPSARIEFVMGASDAISALKTVLTQATGDAAARSRSFDTLDVGAFLVDGELHVSTLKKANERFGEQPGAYWIALRSESSAAGQGPHGDAVHEDGDGSVVPGSDARTSAVLSALKRAPASGAWRLRESMRSAVERIAREAGVTIRLDDEALKRIGVDPSARVEADLDPANFAQALSEVARAAGKDAKGNLGGVIADGEVRISAFDAATEGAAADPKRFWFFVVAGGRR